MSMRNALISGLVGTAAAALAHRAGREVVPQAPEGHILGMRFWSKALRKMDAKAPSRRGLYWITVADTLVSGSLLYGLVGAGRRRGAWGRGAMLGLLMGAAALALPPRLGLGKRPLGRTQTTQAMTFTYPLLGGLAAAAAYNLLERKKLEGPYHITY
jgi:hypothetical protein